jgi:hypothetical protein
VTCIECSVIVKDDSKKLVNKYLLYDALTLELDGIAVKHMVQETMEQFKLDAQAERPTVIIKASMVFQ